MSQIAPVTAHVRSLGRYVTLNELAALLQIPRSSLRDLREREPEKYGPGTVSRLGDSDRPLYLYSLKDVARVEKWLARRVEPHVGRPLMWSEWETRARQIKRVTARRCELRAERYRAEGRPGAVTQERKARRLRRELAAEAAERRASLRQV